MKHQIIEIESIHQCNCCFDNKTLHPLVSIIDLTKTNLTDYSVKFSFYAIMLIENQGDDFIFGRKYYDYSNATLTFLLPGQLIQQDENKPLPRNGWLLIFHPYLICDTTLGMNINKYTFFSYHTNESLHLSSREKIKVIDCLNNIDQEQQQAIDRHSRILISRYIELLLDYCNRYYERQFITRNEANKQILNKVELLLDEYIQSGKLKSKVLPTAEYCSDILQLSPYYFSDLLKFETGKTITEYFQLKRLEIAKKLLQDKNHTIHQVADELGFEDVRYFSKLFQKVIGTTPDKYQLDQN